MKASAEYEAIILGAGPAGFTAGIYLSRFNMKALMLESMADSPNAGSEEAGRSGVYGNFSNVPGYPGGVERRQLKWHGIEQARNFGCEYRIDEALRITQDLEHFSVHCRTRTYTANALFLAMGVKDQWPELPGMIHFAGRSLFWSAASNGKEAEGKPAGVVGNDDHAALEAIRLRAYTSQIVFVTDGAPLNCSEEMKNVLEYLNIPIITARIKTVSGEEGRLTCLITEDNQKLPVQALYFPAHLRIPRSQLALEIGVHVDAAGFIQVNDHFETNIANVYAIGDIASRGPEQVVTSYYHGMQAAWSLYEKRFEDSLHELVVSASHKAMSKR